MSIILIHILILAMCIACTPLAMESFVKSLRDLKVGDTEWYFIVIDVLILVALVLQVTVSIISIFCQIFT